MDVTNFTEPRHLTASEDISGFDCGCHWSMIGWFPHTKCIQH